ncbi:MAG TPA: molybdopterin-dependent oxidoreductase [Thermoanaerobaculia bacterium]|jgi:hypothetical protein|nr:molybdopterin-dependent oxidoreductase [Thermoanaerobaculia bacterium]
MRLPASRLLLAFIVTGLATSAFGVSIIGPKGTREVDAAALASLPQVEVTISDHGTLATFEGVELYSLLEPVGAPDGEHLRGKELVRYVIVEGRDGYRAVFALAELSSAFTDRKVILATLRDGKPLSEKEGPLRIVVEGEKRMGRCVRQVATIRMAVAE